MVAEAADDVTKMLIRNNAPAVVIDVVVLIPDIAFSFALALFFSSWIFLSETYIRA